MKLFIIIAHIFGTSLAIPLVAQRLLSASNSNEVLVGLVNPGLSQGSVMSMLVPGVLQNQLRHQMPGLSQTPNNGQFPPLWTPNLATQSILRDSALEKTYPNPQQPNQMMSYVVPYGIPQQQGQIQYYPLYLDQPAPGIPQQSGNQPTVEQTFGCLVPQFAGEVLNIERIPSGALQLPTKTSEDTLTGKPTLEPNKLEQKVYQDVFNTP